MTAPVQLEALAVAVCGTDGEPVAWLEVGSAGSATPRQGLSLVHFLALPTALGHRRRGRTHFLSLREAEIWSLEEAASGRAGSRAGSERGRARRGPRVTPAAGGGGGGGGGGSGSGGSSSTSSAAVPGSQRSRPGRCDRGLGLPPPPSLPPSAAARTAPPRAHAHARALASADATSPSAGPAPSLTHGGEARWVVDFASPLGESLPLHAHSAPRGWP